jgi:hypothetical protein
MHEHGAFARCRYNDLKSGSGKRAIRKQTQPRYKNPDHSALNRMVRGLMGDISQNTGFSRNTGNFYVCQT